ncbi:Nuclear cap-binding protein subunit 1 [Physocladia obscura]|uniref:Nuclear cap-binding protein subunit 1 n=1 Tax=Physocladia obscura TaxID=109957 RepID=A0AAD5T3C9_9FUNG|nr:Nuclear cap-binding protein subunit 1 [Physocladia obscura]
MAEQRLTQLLIEVGDSSGEIKRGMDNIVVVLLKDLTFLKPVFLTSLISCVTEIPVKTTIYGCLTGLLNLRDSNLVGLVVEAAFDALNDAALNGDFKALKLLLRYFGELVNAGVITAESYLGLLSNVVTVVELQSSMKPLLIDAIVASVLGALPWASFYLFKNDSEGLSKLIALVEIYMNRRRDSLRFGSLGLVFDSLKVYRDCPPSEPYVQVDKLENLWSQILDLQASNWDETLLMRPENALFLELAGGTKHLLRQFIMPQHIEVSNIPGQEPWFWVFDDSVNTPEKILVDLPPTHKIERFIMDDLILDTIHLLSHNHIEAAHFLLNLDKFHKDSDYNWYQSIVENLIRELIKLPSSTEMGIYYATLLFDLCKGAPGKVPSAMGRALRIVFSRMDSESGGVGGGMDVECVTRFGEWSFVLEHEASSKETLEREIRLSYYDRIVLTLPESFKAQPTVFPNTAPTHNYKYGVGFETSDKEFDSLIVRLNRELVGKADYATVVSILEDILGHRKNVYGTIMTGDDLTATKPATSWEDDAVVRDIFVQNILFLGTKSFSHFLNIVERYVKILQQLNGQPDYKLHTVKIISEFWKSSPQNLEIVLDKLMNYRVIDPPSIIAWILDIEILEVSYSRWHLWSILRNVVAKVNSKVAQLRNKIGGVNAMEEDNSSTQEALDNAIRDQKAAYILTFQKFQVCLKHLLTHGEIPGSSAKWRWVSGQMRGFGRTFHAEINKLKFTLEATAFVEPLEPNIAKLWNEIKAVGEVLLMD